MVPIYLTLTVTVQKDGSLNYEYTDLYYKKDVIPFDKIENFFKNNLK